MSALTVSRVLITSAIVTPVLLHAILPPSTAFDVGLFIAMLVALSAGVVVAAYAFSSNTRVAIAAVRVVPALAVIALLLALSSAVVGPVLQGPASFS